MHVWRIIPEKYLDTALSGEGASHTGGRWNHEGHPVLYCSETISLCVLEGLTRLQPQQLTKTFVALKVAFPDDVSIEDFPHITKLDQYFSPTHSKLSRDYGTEWLTQKRSLILRAPSAAMHHEFNYMINTRHELFPNVNIDDVLPLDIDPRVYSNTR